MECKNHPTIAAEDWCSGCGEPFFPDCPVGIHRQKNCGSRQGMGPPGPPGGVVGGGPIPCQETNAALSHALVGIFICGIILEPIAISKAAKAKKMIALNPRLSGSGKATAATVIGVVGLVLWVLGLLTRLARLGR